MPSNNNIIATFLNKQGSLFLAMEAVVEKLKVLESKSASTPLSCPPPRLDRLSFVVKQPRQHELFLKVASWLCNRLEGDSTSTHRHTTVEALVADLSNRQLWGMAQGEKVAALKPGHGNAVCRVLDVLCDAALAKIGFVWQTPVYLPPQEALHKAESKEAEPAKQEDAAKTTPSFKPSQVEAKVAEAKQTVVRVAGGVAEGKGSGACPPRARDDESECKEQRYRERVNQVKAQIEEMKTACQAKQGRVDTLRKELGRMQDRCDRLQHEEEEALRWEHPQGGVGSTEQGGGGGGGGGMIHASPVVKLRAALQKVKEEIRAFDVRIGVVQHILLHRADRLRGLEEEEEEEEEEVEEEERRRSGNEKIITLH